MKFHRLIPASVALLLLLTTTTPLLAQGSRADYDRAAKLGEMTRNKVFRDRVEPNWLTDGDRFWYEVRLPDNKKEFVLINATEGDRQLFADKKQLDDALADLTKDKADNDADKPDKPDDSQPQGRPPHGRRSGGNSSPDGQWRVDVREQNVFLHDTQEDSEQQLTTDGTVENAYGGGVWWSPDSSRFVIMRTEPAQERKVYIVESSPKDQLQPKLQSFNYLKPGDEIAHPKPCLFQVPKKSGDVSETDNADETDVEPCKPQQIPVCDILFPNPWSIKHQHWSPDSAQFYFLYNQRGHDVLRIVSIDACTGVVTPIIEDQSDTFINYAYYEYTNYLDATDEIVWMSERSGWNQLYLIDSKSGEVKNRITDGQWVVRSVDRVDEEKRQIWFQASGIIPGQDPYYMHFCRINFDGSDLSVLTSCDKDPGDGTHSIKYSPDRRFIVDTYSRVDMAPVNVLRSATDGALICELERGDMTQLLATGWRAPERFNAKGRDDETDIYGVIWRPTNFDPKKTYPVIEYIYAGPHSSYTPKSFRSMYNVQKVVELGFIIVQMDGMGTSHRSKAFHDVCWKNIKDSGFPDRIKWIRAAAKKHPEMDISRVGIFGGSAGGQSSTRAMLDHGDFYHVCVSDCGCHDNRMDKIWWNEAWMGWPIDESYAASSNVDDAHKLQDGAKLLLFVGELDHNVDPASTMQVVDALVKADRDFDMIVIPGAGHGCAETPYGQRRRQDYFVRHLLDVEPRWEAEK